MRSPTRSAMRTITALDLPEFDVGDSAAWRALEGAYDAAFLNAGVITGESSIADLTDEQYGRAVRANMDGVVFGVRELAARLMPNGGSIVATASLAGLTATPMDPIYALTKHAVVGFVRSVAPQLAIAAASASTRSARGTPTRGSSPMSCAASWTCR